MDSNRDLPSLTNAPKFTPHRNIWRGRSNPSLPRRISSTSPALAHSDDSGQFDWLLSIGLDHRMDTRQQPHSRHLESRHYHWIFGSINNFLNLHLGKCQIDTTGSTQNGLSQHCHSSLARCGFSYVWDQPRDEVHLWLLKGRDPDDPAEAENSEQETAKDPSRFLCANCKEFIGFPSDVLTVGDIPVLSAQVNPHGFVHEVITIKYVVNTFVVGDPVPADSWFPGYLWRYLLCRRCHSHLGWSYHRPNGVQMIFAGLRKASVVQTS